jgi:hypothetical protein
LVADGEISDKDEPLAIAVSDKDRVFVGSAQASSVREFDFNDFCD